MSGSGGARRPLARPQAVRARRRRARRGRGAGAGVAVWATRDDAVRPVSQETPGPVLLVPGYGGGTAGLEVLADALRVQGREVTVVDLPGDNTGDLDRRRGSSTKAVDPGPGPAGARSVDVVGYSAGGVVARLWVREHGGGSLARRVVTLGSPHHGTDLAGLGGDVAPGLLPRGVPPAPARQRAAAQAQRRRRDARGTAVGVDLDDRRPHRGPAVVVGARRRSGFTLQSVCPRRRRQPRRAAAEPRS